jgi:anti-sigma factor RsiW
VTNQQMGEACRGWRGDLAAYLVGALDPQPCGAVRRHLGTCPACRAEYEDLAMVVACLALFSRAPRPSPTTRSDRRVSRK